jgi:hypothetical protein
MAGIRPIGSPIRRSANKGAKHFSPETRTSRWGGTPAVRKPTLTKLEWWIVNTSQVLAGITRLKSLSFGALLGSGVAGLGFSVRPGFFPGGSLESIVILGAIIGMGAERFGGKVFHPVCSFLAYYSKLGQIITLRRRAILSDEQAKKIIDILTTEFFL